MNKNLISELEQKALELPEEPSVYRNLGDLYVKQGLFRECIDFFSVILINNINIHPIIKGVIYSEIGIGQIYVEKYNDAIQSFEYSIHCVKQGNSCEHVRVRGDAFYYLSNCYRYIDSRKAQEVSEAALREYSSLISKCTRYSGDKEILMNICELCINVNDYQKGIIYSEKILACEGLEEPDKTRVMLIKSQLCEHNNDVEKAEHYLFEALKYAKSNNQLLSIAHENIGIHYHHKNDYMNSRKHLKSAIKYMERDNLLQNDNLYKAEIFIYMGLIEYSSKKWSLAISYLKEALSIIKVNHYLFPSAMLTIAHAYFSISEYSNAYVSYQAVLDSSIADDEQKKEAREYSEQCLNVGQ